MPASGPGSGRWQRPVPPLPLSLAGAARPGEPRASLPAPAGSAKGARAHGAPCAPAAPAEALTLQGSPGRGAPGGHRAGWHRPAASVGKHRRSSGGDLPGRTFSAFRSGEGHGESKDVWDRQLVRGAGSKSLWFPVRIFALRVPLVTGADKSRAKLPHTVT